MKRKELLKKSMTILVAATLAFSGMSVMSPAEEVSTVEVTEDAAAAEAAAAQAAAEEAARIAAEEAAAQAAAEAAAAEAAAAQAAAEAAAAEAATEAPTEAPDTEAVTEAPATEAATEGETAGQSEEISTEGESASEEGTEAQTAEEETAAPAETEISTETEEATEEATEATTEEATEEETEAKEVEYLVTFSLETLEDINNVKIMVPDPQPEDPGKLRNLIEDAPEEERAAKKIKLTVKDTQQFFYVIAAEGWKVKTVKVVYENLAENIKNEYDAVPNGQPDGYVIRDLHDDLNTINIELEKGEARKNLVTFEADEGVAIAVFDSEIAENTGYAVDGKIEFKLFPDEGVEIDKVLVDDETEVRKAEDEITYVIEGIQTDETIVKITTKKNDMPEQVIGPVALEDGTQVVFQVPEGALPEGTTAELIPLDAEEMMDQIRTTAGDETLEKENVSAYSFVFRTADEEEVKPLLPITAEVISPEEEIAQAVYYLN